MGRPLPVPTTPSKKRKNAAPTLETPPPNPNTARRAGAPAYLKPNLNWSQFSLTYIVCDENGSAANDQFLRLTDGLTLAQAHSDAIKHFDKHESRRVTIQQRAGCLLGSLASPNARAYLWFCEQPGSGGAPGGPPDDERG